MAFPDPGVRLRQHAVEFLQHINRIPPFSQWCYLFRHQVSHPEEGGAKTHSLPREHAPESARERTRDKKGRHVRACSSGKLKSGGSRGFYLDSLAWGPPHMPAAEQMKMKVRHGLTTVMPDVCNQSISTLGQTLSSRYLSSCQHDFTD